MSARRSTDFDASSAFLIAAFISDNSLRLQIKSESNWSERSCLLYGLLIGEPPGAERNCALYANGSTKTCGEEARDFGRFPKLTNAITYPLSPICPRDDGRDVPRDSNRDTFKRH